MTFFTEEGARLFSTEEEVKTFFAGVEMELISEGVVSLSLVRVLKHLHHRCAESSV